MMLVTTRPTFQHGFGGHPIVTKLALNRLGRDQIASIVDGLARAAVEPSATSSAEMRDALDDYRRTGARFSQTASLTVVADEMIFAPARLTRDSSAGKSQRSHSHRGACRIFIRK
jgi:hypothetical protein